MIDRVNTVLLTGGKFLLDIKLNSRRRDIDISDLILFNELAIIYSNMIDELDSKSDINRVIQMIDEIVSRNNSIKIVYNNL